MFKMEWKIYGNGHYIIWISNLYWVKKINIIVTGGAGFIGSTIAERLLSEGHEVCIIDNESTGSRYNVPKKSHYYCGSINKLSDLEEVFSEDIDAVYHIAGQVSLIDSFINPIHDLRTNIEGTVNIINMCLKYKISRLL